MAQRIERDSRDTLYASLLGKSQTFHNRQRIGDIMARATNDVRMLNIMFSPGLMLITDSLVGLVAPLVLITQIDTRLLLTPVMFRILFIITSRGYARRLSPVSEGMRESFGVMNAGLAETVGGIEVVKGNAQEAQEGGKFARDAGVYRDYAVREGEIQARYLPMLVFSICWGLAFLHAMLLWRAGDLTLGQVVSYVGLVGFLRFPTFVSIFTFQLAQLGVASARRILELINAKTELDENQGGVAQPIAGAVEFRDVSFRYEATSDERRATSEDAPDSSLVTRHSSLHILKNITFSAQPGETVAIVGQTGGGKSTLTRLINRIFDVDSGQVLVDGVDVREKEPSNKTIKLGPEIVFPTQQVTRIIKAAREGKSLLELSVYDGSDNGEKVYKTLTVIGAPIAADVPQTDSDAATGKDGMMQSKRWPVTVSYYDSSESNAKGEQTPVYAMSFQLYDNGVSRALKLDYNDFVIAGKISSFETHPVKSCK